MNEPIPFQPDMATRPEVIPFFDEDTSTFSYIVVDPGSNAGTRPSRLAWLLKEKILPPIYWQAMLKGKEWLASPEASQARE